MKRTTCAALIACLLLALVLPAMGEMQVERREGEAYFPDEKNWVYHFTYAYPRLAGEDYASAAINDTYEMALDEMIQLVLPMFANAPDMRYEGKNEVIHDFSVFCNNGRVLSIVQKREQRLGGEDTRVSREALTFGVSGLYEGEALTLRGVILLQAGVDPVRLDDAALEEYPEVAHIIEGSSTLIGEKLLPVLYRKFEELQSSGAARADVSRDAFEEECVPTADFYANDAGELVFFFQPALLTDPGAEGTAVSLTPAELDALLAEE